MDETNFEKQVREKMDQFGFDPQEVVWTHIDQAINAEKKRRIPVIWIFFFTSLLLSGGGYFYISLKKPVNILKTGKPGKDTGLNPGRTTDLHTGINTNGGQNKKTVPQKTNENITEAGSPEQGKPGETGGHLKKQAFNPVIQDSGDPGNGNIFKSERENPPAIINPPAAGNGNAAEGRAVPDEGGAFPAETTEKKVSGNSKQQVAKDSGLEEAFTPAAGKKSPVTDSLTTQAAVKKVTVADSLTTQAAVKKLTVTDSLTNQAAVKKARIANIPTAWSWGLTGTAGISGLSQGLFKPVNAYGSNYSATPAAGGAAGGGNNYRPSTLSAGFAYSAGALVKRNLSERLYLSAGIGYHYYSTKILTGSRVDSTLYLYSANAAVTQVSSYYRNGAERSFTNQYHFIELPVMAGFRIIRNRQKPVIWEAGLSFSILAGSNALQFNSNSGAYYPDNQLLHQSQWSASTSLIFGWSLKGGLLQLGPCIQYGLGTLAKARAGNPGHLFDYGLKIYFFPGK